MRGKAPRELIQQRAEVRKKKAKGTEPANEGKKWRWDWKYLLGTLIAVVGLLPFLPNPAIAVQPPLDPENVFTSRFEISNPTPVLSLKAVTVKLMKIHVNYVNHVVVRESIAQGAGYSPPEATLEPGEAETVPFTDFEGDSAGARTADIALIATFKPVATFFPTRRKAFRFKSVKQADGHLRLEAQPAGDALAIYDRVMNDVAGGPH